MSSLDNSGSSSEHGPTSCPWCASHLTHAYPVDHDQSKVGTKFFACGCSWCHVDGMRPQHERCLRDMEMRAEGERAERERWTDAARTHAHAWQLMGTPGGGVIASDFLMWAASMQPVNDEGMRPFTLAPVGGLDHGEAR